MTTLCRPLSLLAVLALTACGVSPSPGTASNTLAVIANVASASDVANSSDGNQYETSYVVFVTRGGLNVVDNAVVKSRRNGSEITLAWQSVAYTFTEVGIPNGGIELNVEAGADFLRGAVVEAPGLHVLTNPLPGGSYPANTPMNVTWNRGPQADSVELRVHESGNIAVADTGSYAMPAANLTAQTGAPVRLVRSNTQPLNGLSSSQLTATFSQNFEINLQ
jgi:hypothetical protein